MVTKEMVRVLRCPTDPTAELRVSIGHEEDDRIIEGALRCDKLGIEFPIHNGVPNLMPPEIGNNGDWELWKQHLDGFHSRRMVRKKPGRKLPHPSPKTTHLAFFKFAEITEGTVLDVGCGPGKLRQYLDETRVTYYGLDPLPMDETDSFRFIYGLGEHIPFEDSMFSYMLVISALDHFKDLDRFFAESKRVLKDDGRLMILQSVHGVNGPLSLLRMLAHLAKDGMDSLATREESRKAPKHMNEFNQRTLAKAVRKSFEIDRIETYSKNWYSPEKLFVSLKPLS